MSSLRNSLHRRNHKERSQLAHRSRLGILEKHKDYVLRARDYHSKQDRITRLRQKAADRNKDEFYYAMNRQRTERGVHVQERGNEALPTDIVKVLKSQDENYIRTTRLAGLKKIDRLKAQLSTIANLLGSSSLGGDAEEDEDELEETELEILREAGIIPPPASTSKRSKSRRTPAKHIVFADSGEHADQLKASTGTQNPAMSPQSVQPAPGPFDMGWKTADVSVKSKKGKSRATESGPTSENAEEQRKEALEHRSRLLKELSARLHRDQQMRYAERELEMQKLLMGKGTSRKVAGVEKVMDEDEEDEDEDAGPSRRKTVNEKTWKPRVYKWKLERKR